MYSVSAQTFLPVPRRPVNGRWANCQSNLSQISLASLVPPDPADRPDWILPWDINCMQALRATTYHTLHWAVPTHPPAAMDLPPIVFIFNHGRTSISTRLSRQQGAKLRVHVQVDDGNTSDHLQPRSDDDIDNCSLCGLHSTRGPQVPHPPFCSTLLAPSRLIESTRQDV